jgi:opacity protein-like surface antigen
MKSLRFLAFASVAAALLWAGSARALGAEAGLGADYLPDDSAGSFMGFLALDSRIAPYMRLGARFGLMLESNPSRFGIPADARLRFSIRRFYLDGLAGGALFFKDNPRFRFHAGAGLGYLVARNVRFGAEVGYLDPSLMVGLRVSVGF